MVSIKKHRDMCVWSERNGWIRKSYVSPKEVDAMPPPLCSYVDAVALCCLSFMCEYMPRMPDHWTPTNFYFFLCTGFEAKTFSPQFLRMPHDMYDVDAMMI